MCSDLRRDLSESTLRGRRPAAMAQEQQEVVVKRFRSSRATSPPPVLVTIMHQKKKENREGFLSRQKPTCSETAGQQISPTVPVGTKPDLRYSDVTRVRHRDTGGSPEA